MMPDFTIVTPSFNYARYIGDCVSSVASQQGATFEHLVFDGGSTDETLDILKNHPNISLVSEPDKGMCDAINKGFDKARGRWVMWLNADDRLLPGALAAVKEFASRHPDADVIFGCWNFVDAAGEHQKTMTLFPFSRAMMLYLGCYIGSTATFYRRETVIDKGERLNLDFRYVMDGEFYARLASKGFRFDYIPRVLADFRLHGNNLSLRNYGKKDASAWLVLQKQFSETRAYRRAYGRTCFKDENLNTLVDSILYLFYRALKPILKLMHKGKTSNA